MPPTGKHVVFGANGPVGKELVRLLHEAGRNVVPVARHGGFETPEGLRPIAGDAARTEDTYRLCMGSEVVYCCVGVDYTKWADSWPAIINGLIEGVSNAGSRLVFADNLYSYGPVTEPMREDMPLTSYGSKPALRTKLVQSLKRANDSGRCPTVIVKASDFYGPGVLNAMLGERVFVPALSGKPAQLMGDVSKRHAYTYAPDFSRALMLAGADNGAYGRIWNCPSAPALSTEEVIALIFRETGTDMKLQVLPRWMIGMLAMSNPLLRELKELAYQFENDYLVDDSAFRQRFKFEPTGLTEGIRATVAWYRENAERLASGNGNGGSGNGGKRRSSK